MSNPTNKEQIGADRRVVPRVVALLRSTDKKVQCAAATTLHSLADVHEANQQRIVRQGGIQMLVPLLTSTDAALQGAAAHALYNLCSTNPEDADWIEIVAGVKEGLARLLYTQQEQLTTSRAVAAMTMVICAAGRPGVMQALEQNASAVWAALPPALITNLGLHSPEVWVFLQALRLLATGASQPVRQSMHSSTQLRLMLQHLNSSSSVGEVTKDVVQDLLQVLSQGKEQPVSVMRSAIHCECVYRPLQVYGGCPNHCHSRSTLQ